MIHFCTEDREDKIFCLFNTHFYCHYAQHARVEDMNSLFFKFCRPFWKANIALHLAVMQYLLCTKTFRNVSLEIAGSQLNNTDKARSDLNVNVNIARSTGGNFRKGQTLGTVLSVPRTSFKKDRDSSRGSYGELDFFSCSFFFFFSFFYFA